MPRAYTYHWLCTHVGIRRSDVLLTLGISPPDTWEQLIAGALTVANSSSATLNGGLPLYGFCGPVQTGEGFRLQEMHSVLNVQKWLAMVESADLKEVFMGICRVLKLISW